MTVDPELVALTVSRDQRFAVLEQAIAVEADMRDNATVKALIAYIRSDAELAMAELAETSPLDSKAVAVIASRVRAYTLLKRLLETILTRGKIAEQEIRQQDERHYSDDLPD